VKQISRKRWTFWTDLEPSCQDCIYCTRKRGTQHEIEQIEEFTLTPQAAIQEFIRLTEVSAGVPHKLRPNERTYKVYAATDPEGFSPFRDHNETYLRMVSSFELQTARDDPALLARWMI
jgi:hypothetical protein